MGIYVIHPFVISAIKHFILVTSNFFNIFLTFIVFIICATISYIIYNIPKLNSTIKL